MKSWAVTMFLLAAAGLSSVAAAKSITLNGITFSDEEGGLVLIEGSGSGTAADPFVVVEEITDKGAAILTIRGFDSGFGNLIQSHHNAGFSLVKVVRNGTDQSWFLFNLELREFKSASSPYEDGLSFGQGSRAGRPFHSDRYPDAREIQEPFDSVSFSGAEVPPGGTVAFRVVVTDMSPTPVFYLMQRRERPSVQGPVHQVAGGHLPWRNSRTATDVPAARILVSHRGSKGSQSPQSVPSDRIRPSFVRVDLANPIHPISKRSYSSGRSVGSVTPLNLCVKPNPEPPAHRSWSCRVGSSRLRRLPP